MPRMSAYSKVTMSWPRFQRYIDKTVGGVTFEYALMRGINDSPALAQEMAVKLAPLLCHVNLIPLNPIPDSPYQPTSDEDTARFAQILTRCRRGHHCAPSPRHRD